MKEKNNKEKNNKNVENNKKIENTTENKKFNKKIVCIFIIILIVLIVVLGIIFILNKSSKNKSSTTNGVLTEEQMINEVEKGQERHDTIQKHNLENVELINGEKHNTSETLLKERTWNDLLIKDIELYSENGMTVFSANVVNETNKDIEDKMIQILFKDNEGNVYGRVNGYLGDIKAGNTKKLYVTTSSDYTNAYDFEIEASN